MLMKKESEGEGKEVLWPLHLATQRVVVSIFVAFVFVGGKSH